MRRTGFAIALAAVAAAAPASAQAPDQTLRIALADDADILDPTLARTLVGRMVFTAMCDKLFDIDAKLGIVPQLASGYEWTDNRTLVVKLRPDVVMHDGAKMDAEMVKYSIVRHQTMPGSFRRGELAALDRVEVVDPLTVRFVLKTPSAPFLSQLTDRAGMIVSTKAAEAAGKDFGLRPVCTGPFRFTERVAQDRIVLDRFADYYDASHFHFARVVFRPIVDSSVRLANLQAGAIDMAERIQPSDADAIRKDPKLRLTVLPGLGYQGITFNVGNGPRANTPIGQDKRVRQAFALAVDRAALVQVVYNGMYVPVAQAVPAESPFFDPSVQPAPRDPAKARALLMQTGLKLPVPVTLTVTNSPDQRQTGEVIQAMAAEAGFDVKVNQMEFAASLDADDRGDFEAHLVGWSGRVDADGNLWSFLHVGGPNNVGRYASKDMDTWLDDARAVTDIPARRALYGRVAQLTVTDVPILYLYTPQNLLGTTAKLQGFRPVPDWMLRLRDVTLAK